jgi:hypothetical protein
MKHLSFLEISFRALVGGSVKALVDNSTIERVKQVFCLHIFVNIDKLITHVLIEFFLSVAGEPELLI